jgi:hypothetical protein
MDAHTAKVFWVYYFSRATDDPYIISIVLKLHKAKLHSKGLDDMHVYRGGPLIRSAKMIED